MTLLEAKLKYNEVFGPIPIMVLSGRNEEDQKKMLLNAIKSGKELKLVDFIPVGVRV